MLLQFNTEMRLGHLTVNFWVQEYLFCSVWEQIYYKLLVAFSQIYLFPSVKVLCSCCFSLIPHYLFFKFQLHILGYLRVLDFSICCKFLNFFRLLYLSLGESYRGGGRGKWDINNIIKLLDLTVKHRFPRNTTNKI